MKCKVLRIQVTLLIIVFAYTYALGVEHTAVKQMFTKFNDKEFPVTREERSVRIPINFTNVEEFNDTFNTDDPFETVEMFCPSSWHHCSSANVSVSVGDLLDSPCCIPCERTGTCCRKVSSATQHPEENLHSDLNETCVETYIGGTETQYDIRDIDSYLLIKSCSHDAMLNGEDDIEKRCILPDSNALEEMIPVYSKETGRNYGNIFCAICNNDTITILPWESNFVCRNNSFSFLSSYQQIPNDVDRTNSTVLLQGLRNTKGCILKWTPTFGKVNMCIDEDRVIAKCTDTTFNTKRLETLCQEINSPVIGQFDVYKNVFCLACNEGLTVFNGLCNKEEPKGILDLQTSFSAILGLEIFTAIQDPPNIMNLARCKDEMSYDETLKTCIQKTCPISQVKAGDRCVPMLKTIKGISFDYRLKLVYSFNSFNKFSKEDVLTGVKHLVLHNTGRICAEKVAKIQHQGEQIVVHLQLTKTSDDSEGIIEEEFEVFKQNIRNERAKKGQAYTVEMDNSPFEPIYTGYLNYGIYNDYNFHKECGNSVAVSSIQTCSTVLVTEFHSQEGGAIVISGQTFLPGEYIISINRENTERRSVHICYDLYVTRMMAASNQFNGSRNIKPLKRAFLILTLYLLSVSPN